ncbi:hypothetical protein BGX27_005876, partial [Mortierella sp. AM989]
MSHQQDNTPIPSLASSAQEVHNANLQYRSQLETLKKLPVPYSDIYEVLTSCDSIPIKPLGAKIRKAASDLTLWLETAKLAVLGLEMEMKQEGASGKHDVDEIETIMNRFNPNIEMMMELKDKVGSRLEMADVKSDQPNTTSTEDTESCMTREELQKITITTQSNWNMLKIMLDEVKGIFASAQARREILTHMENVLAEIEEIGLGIDRFQEERMHQSPDIAKSVATPSSPPFLHSAPLLDTSTEDSQNKQRSTEDMNDLDARIELLTPRISALTAQIEELTSIDFKGNELQDQYREMLSLWDDTKARREKIGEELKEEKWLVVFEQVAKQIESMMDSIDRAIVHCQGLVDQIIAMVEEKMVPAAPIDREHLYTIFKSFEAKHKYYAPAVNKMLNMLENGIENRATKNAEVIQKHRNMKASWEQLRGRLDRVELDLDGIEEMLDYLDASIPSHIPTPPAQLPEKPLFAMRRSQIQPELKSPGPLTLFQPPQQDHQQQRGRRTQPKPVALQSPVQSPKESTLRSRNRSPLNTKTRHRPWSPTPSVSSLSSMLSPNMSNNFRSISRSSSHSPSRPISDKPRPWCPSTSTSSPSIPGKPYAPSSASTYTPRSKSTTRNGRGTSPAPEMPSRSNSAMSKLRSTSCTPAMGRASSQPKPIFSPAGSMSKLSSGAQVPRSVSPAPAPASVGGRKIQSNLPPPVTTNTSSRPRQNSAPGTPTPQRRSSSPLPFNRDSQQATSASQSSRQRAFSPPVATRQRRPSGQNAQGISQIGYRDQEGGLQRNRRSSLGNFSTSQSLGVMHGSGLDSGLGSAPSMGLEGCAALPFEEPTSPSTSSSSS